MRPALDKKQLRREIEHSRRAKVAERLTELARLLKAARESRREAIDRIRLQCRAARQKLKSGCDARKEGARREGNEVVKARRNEIHDERSLERSTRSADRRRSPGPIGRIRNVRREREQESDDEVRRNLPPELVQVFEHERRHIKGSDRKSRTEAFLQWVEENPGEVYALQEREAARELKRLLREHARESRARAVAEVPF